MMSKKIINQSVKIQSDNQWNANVDAEGKRLRDVKKSTHCSFFIRHDPKPVVCLRARLRQDVANNSLSRYRRNLSSSPSCTRCLYPEDSREHLLLHCPAFSSPRS